MNRVILFLLLSTACFADYKTGIDIAFSGTAGTDYVIEQPYHNRALNDTRVIYLRSTTAISFSHNARNIACVAGGRNLTVIGANGLDGVPSTGDEGQIRYAVDELFSRNHWAYKTPAAGSLFKAYSSPFTLAAETYTDGSTVLGATGNNGGTYRNSLGVGGTFFYKGFFDAAGNETHVLRYADDDALLLGSDDSRASDGAWVILVVNPLTPALSVQTTSGAGQFYSTPKATYLVAKAHAQTTYLNADTQITLTDLYGAEVEYRIDGGSWSSATGSLVIPAATFATGSHTLEYRSVRGASPIATRTVVKNPTHPSLAETHGNYAWVDAAGWSAILTKITRAPFSTTYANMLSNDRSGQLYWNTSGGLGWRLGSRRTLSGGGLEYANTVNGKVLINAFVAKVQGYTAIPSGGTKSYAKVAKEMMLDGIANTPPVGLEDNDFSNQPIPCLDLWYRGYWDSMQVESAIFAYDIIAANYRDDQYTGGLTAIEDHFFRDTMASWVNLCSLMTQGHGGIYAGMWDGGWKTAATAITAIMPNYSTPYYGTNGMDGNTTVYTQNPFLTVGYTWKQLYMTHSYTLGSFPNAPVRPYGWEGYSDSMIRANGDWGDKPAYMSYAQMGERLGIYWNVQKISNAGGDAHTAISTYIDRVTLGTAVGLKAEYSGGPVPTAPYRLHQVINLNSRHPTASANATAWIQSLASNDVNSDNTAVADSGVYGFYWYDDQYFGGADVISPTLLSATVSPAGTTIVLQYSEPVVFGAGGNGGWTLSSTGGALTMSYASGSGTSTLTYNLSRLVYDSATETLTKIYTQPTNGIEDAAGNDAASVSSSSVTNSSTQTLTTIDTTPPAVAITSPTTASTFATTLTDITLVGTCSDNVAVTQVSWVNDRGGVGISPSDLSLDGWAISAIPLQSGLNIITVTARDEAGNSNTATINVTFTAPTGSAITITAATVTNVL